ncbi:hypothetical protein LOK49_LG06G00651 [Camellia lanceoleosa]|uniref:Uncharacterized protein n=1 Tax=Camellia lanceoleosa TaxID=1840588 RepID=A0ACC0HAQ9_9ERIC|nr:hypothetical protein LOK49_LG06G00651 [Camellia lanceoleosa]
MKMIRCQAISIPADRVPDIAKRELMNWLILGAISLPTISMLIPYTTFFATPGSGGAGGGTVAKDTLGNDVIAEEWLKTHDLPGPCCLTPLCYVEKMGATECIWVSYSQQIKHLTISDQKLS